MRQSTDEPALPLWYGSGVSAWRQVIAALLVALAVVAALAAVPLFFPAGSRWPAFAVVAVLGGLALVGVVSHQAPRLDWQARIAAASVVSFLVGLGAFVAFAAVETRVYEERPQPGWLMALWLVAVVLIGLGIVGIVVSASGRLRRSSRRFSASSGPARHP